jgi:hypothetical protein
LPKLQPTQSDNRKLPGRLRRENESFIDLLAAVISHSLAEGDDVCSNWKLRDSFAGCCCLADPFFAGRESFSLSEAISGHTLPAVDRGAEKVVLDLPFSIL